LIFGGPKDSLSLDQYNSKFKFQLQPVSKLPFSWNPSRVQETTRIVGVLINIRKEF
jgi:hypothetical protein